MFIPEIKNSQIEIENTIKILLYSSLPEFTASLNLDESECFLEPLLFPLLQTEKSKIKLGFIQELLQNYTLHKKELVLIHSLRASAPAYIPSLGYFNEKGNLIKSIQLLKESSIELVQFRLTVLDGVFRTRKEEKIDATKIEISERLNEKFIDQLNHSISILKSTSSEYFKLIESCCKKILLFKTAPENTNSFATINAHGIAFFNAYQEEYDEVFFIDDISHQTGHIILTTLFFTRANSFKINSEIEIAEIVKDEQEYRTLHVLLQALYTYYTSIHCLTRAIEQCVFNSDQVIEAKGRIGFYMVKYEMDIEKLKRVYDHFGGIENVLKGQVRDLFVDIEVYCQKLKDQIKLRMNYTLQPYNYTHQLFLKENDEFI